jgi:hypothetical protein
MKEEENKVIGNPNNWHIEVYPRSAGNFGYYSISSIKYNTKEAENLASDMQDEIKRHTNDVSGTRMVYDSFICLKCENEFDTEKEAINCNHE